MSPSFKFPSFRNRTEKLNVSVESTSELASKNVQFTLGPTSTSIS